MDVDNKTDHQGGKAALAVLRSTASIAAMTSCEFRRKGRGRRCEAVQTNLVAAVGPPGGVRVGACSRDDDDDDEEGSLGLAPAAPLPALPGNGADVDLEAGVGALAVFSLAGAPALASSDATDIALPGACGCFWLLDAPVAPADDGAGFGFLE